MTGITFVTVFALIAGLLVHGLTQLITARRAQVDVTLRKYFLDHWPETTLAIICAIVMYAALPELATRFPDLAGQVGFGKERTVLSSFLCGFVGNWFANFLGGRARSLTGVSP